MRKECADIVFDAVVVGSSRTHPVLIIESEGSNLTESRRRQIAAQIVDKTAHTNQGMFPYERIKDPAWIIVLEKGSLPRTKVCRMIITHLREDPLLIPRHVASRRRATFGMCFPTVAAGWPAYGISREQTLTSEPPDATPQRKSSKPRSMPCSTRNRSSMASVLAFSELRRSHPKTHL